MTQTVNVPGVGQLNFPDGMSEPDMAAAIQKNYPEIHGKASSSNTDVAINAANKGIAALPDSILNAPNNVLNLLKAGFGTAAGALGRNDLMPELTPNPDWARKTLEAAGAINPAIQPQGFVQKAIDYGMQGAVGGALTGGAGLGRTIAGAGLGMASGLAAGGTQEATGNPAWAATAGMLTPAAIGKVPAVVSSAAEPLMRSALKPTLPDMRAGKGDRAVQTLLKEGINPTNEGVAKLETMLDGLNSQLSGVMQKYAGKTVDKGAVASRIQDVVSKIEKSNPTPQDALRDVQKVYDDFIQNGFVPKNIPVQQAQDLKRGLYQVLKTKYGLPITDDTINAQKALARGFKETLEGVAPEVAPINARMGDLANARNVTERRAMVEGNKNPFGLTLLTHSPMAALGFMADRSAAVKGLLARGAYNANDGGILSQSAQNVSPIVTQGILADILRRRQ